MIESRLADLKAGEQMRSPRCGQSMIEKRLTDLRTRQQAGEHLPCPRCGQDTMKPNLHTNALSRHVHDVYICDSCGTAEAMLDFMHQTLPVTMWAICKPLRPSSEFGSMTAEDVLAKIMHEQLETLSSIYKRCQANPEKCDEYRAEAFERCPGLTELWTQPFAARYDSKDRPILIRFRMTDGEVQVAANILEIK